jgi:endonuclease/exonuclease/phosphatase family metal-dependent hydrolase
LNLQELDDYWTFFRPRLESAGWSSIYCPRPALHPSNFSGKKKQDGLGIFYKQDKLKVMEVEMINYSDDHDRIALIGLFKHHMSGYILIANTHLYWNSLKVDTQVAELKELDESIRGLFTAYKDKYQQRDIPVIVSGDFNNSPSSPVYNYMTRDSLLVRILNLHIPQ